MPRFIVITNPRSNYFDKTFEVLSELESGVVEVRIGAKVRGFQPESFRFLKEVVDVVGWSQLV